MLGKRRLPTAQHSPPPPQPGKEKTKGDGKRKESLDQTPLLLLLCYLLPTAFSSPSPSLRRPFSPFYCRSFFFSRPPPPLKRRLNMRNSLSRHRQRRRSGYVKILSLLGSSYFHCPPPPPPLCPFCRIVLNGASLWLLSQPFPQPVSGVDVSFLSGEQKKPRAEVELTAKAFPEVADGKQPKVAPFSSSCHI